MTLKLLAAAAVAVTAASALMPVPALAYDPCTRAQQDVEEAEAAVQRWYATNCPTSGTCTGNPARLFALGERVNEARARRNRACSY